jgi:hypothetical protein
LRSTTISRSSWTNFHRATAQKKRKKKWINKFKGRKRDKNKKRDKTSRFNSNKNSSRKVDKAK